MTSNMNKEHEFLCHPDGSVCMDGCDRAADPERLEIYQSFEMDALVTIAAAFALAGFPSTIATEDWSDDDHDPMCGLEGVACPACCGPDEEEF